MLKRYVIFSVPLNGFWDASFEGIQPDFANATQYNYYADAETALQDVVYGQWNISGPLEIREYFIAS